MNKFLTLAFLFSAGCVIGWCIELLYRRFSPANTSKSWINPGFLIGPYLPIYGFGLCALYLLAGLEQYIAINNPIASKLLLFAAMAACMTVIEYIAGIIFIKKMNVKLWDYSNEPFNFQGVICLRFSVYWALLGAVYYFFVHPYILGALDWFSRNLAFSFVIGVFYGVFAVDVFYSFRIVTKIRKFAKENEVLIKYEELKRHIRDVSKERKEKYRFIFALRSPRPLHETLKAYIEEQKRKVEQQRKKG